MTDTAQTIGFSRPRSGKATRSARTLARVVALAAVVALALLVLPGVARAASGDFVFTGRGWGHGAGMSQWGAWEAAREGVSFDDILAFYYPGTTLTSMEEANTEVRVKISSKPWTSSNTTDYTQVDLRPSVTAMDVVGRGPDGEQIENVPLGTLLNVICSQGKVTVISPAGSSGPFDYVDIVPAPGEGDSTEGRVAIQLATGNETVEYREYWGTIRVQPSSVAGKLWVYNIVDLEKYVRSIAEVDYDWARSGSAAYAYEAVKAQAVAARTYAVAKNGPLADNQYDQCYRGYSFEASNPGIARAAEDTAGLILTYNGKAISAYFSAHSGGYTTDSAWSGTTPAYIVSRPDPWSLAAPPASMNSAGPGYTWSYAISPGALSDKVNGHLTDSVTKQTVSVGMIERVEIVARDTADPESHAKSLLLTGSSGTATVTASSFRELFGYSAMRSTLILTITGGGPLPAGEFYDVGPSNPYRADIARIVTAGLMTGYEGGIYKPDGSITHWQFAKVAVGLSNLMHPDDEIPVVDVSERPFSDVPVSTGLVGDPSDWIAAARNAGLVSGSVSSNFGPYSILRRDEMAWMMCHALGWDDEAARLSGDTEGFNDVPPSSGYWAAATYLKQQGIILGYPDAESTVGTLLRVDEAIKRQHVAVILCRALDAAH